LYIPPICGTLTWRFVGEDDGGVGDELEQRGRRLARGAAGQVARIVLDAVADARGLEHLEVELGALLEPLRLQQLALGIRAGRGAGAAPRGCPGWPAAASGAA
jgi:hypothetical protein